MMNRESRAEVLALDATTAPTRERARSRPRVLANVGLKKRTRTGSRHGTARRRLTGTLTALALALAAWAGSYVGSGAFQAEARFNAERLAAQNGTLALYGPADVPGHPGSDTGLKKADLLRQFIALDGVN